MTEQRAEYKVADLTAAERAELRQRHHHLFEADWCACDGAPWPCPTIRAVEQLERQEAALDWVLEQVSWRDWYYWPMAPDEIDAVIGRNNARVGDGLARKAVQP